MDMPAISGLSSDGRLVAFINKALVHVPLISVVTAYLANQSEAEVGTEDKKGMTPLTTKQAINAQVPAMVDSLTDGRIASQAQAEAGTDNDNLMTPLRTAQYVGTLMAVDMLSSVAANTTTSVPAGWAIDNIFFANTTANAVSVKIGTTSGASDVMVIDVGANALADSFQSLDWILKKRLFSVSADQTLYVQSAAWNSASLNIRVKRSKIF